MGGKIDRLISGETRGTQVRSSLMLRCERCLKLREVRYRVQSDILNIVVCDMCAEAGRNLGLAVENAAAVEKEKRRSKLSPGAPDEVP